MLKSTLILAVLMNSTLSFSQDIFLKDIREHEFYNLSGSDGSRGSNGADGYTSSCSVVNEAVSGGDGSDGGSGSDGGDGGDVYVNYTDLAELKNLEIISVGGAGGPGGDGGNGGDGCYGGSGGSAGSTGRDGYSGSSGHLYLIKNPQMYIYPKTWASGTLSKYITKGETLIEHIWDNKSGALDLLFPKSELSDTYYVLRETFERKVYINWQSSREISIFENERISTSLNDKKIKFDFSKNMAIYTVEDNGLDYVATITDFIQVNELINLKAFKISGIDQNLKLIFEDKGSDFPGIEKKFSFILVRNNIWRNPTAVEMPDVKNYLTVEGNIYTIHLGKMKMDKAFKKKGAKLEFEITATYKREDQYLTKKYPISFEVK